MLTKDLQEFHFYNYYFITRNAYEQVLQYIFNQKCLRTRLTKSSKHAVLKHETDKIMQLSLKQPGKKDIRYGKTETVNIHTSYT